MAEKNKKKKQRNGNYNTAFQYDYVGADVLALLFGVSISHIYKNQFTNVLDGVSIVKQGHGRMYNFNQAARLAYPTLSDFELAILRLEINDKLRNRENKDVESEMG